MKKADTEFGKWIIFDNLIYTGIQEMQIGRKTLAVGILASLLSATQNASKANDSKFLPPNPQNIKQVGCKITQDQLGWSTKVYAKYQISSEDFRALLSIRDKRKDAFKDCDLWMNEVDKLIRAERKSK